MNTQSVLQRLEPALDYAERIATAGGAVTALIVNDVWRGTHVSIVDASIGSVARVLERAGIPESSWEHNGVDHGSLLCVEEGACRPPTDLIWAVARGLEVVGVCVSHVNWSYAMQSLSVSGTAVSDVSGPVGAALGACCDVVPEVSSVCGQSDGSMRLMCRYRVGVVVVEVRVVWRASNVDNVT